MWLPVVDETDLPRWRPVVFLFAVCVLYLRVIKGRICRVDRAHTQRFRFGVVLADAWVVEGFVHYWWRVSAILLGFRGA